MVFYNDVTNMCLISIPQKYGQGKEGVETGPEVLLAHGLKEKIEGLGIKIQKEEIVKPEIKSGMTKLQICGDLCNRIAHVVHENSKRGLFCLNIGGDHSIGTGTIAGMLKTHPDLAVLWIDAHTDINTINSSPSGNVHGMPASFLIDDKLVEVPKPIEYSWCTTHLKSPSHLSYIGIRQSDDGEIELVKKLKIPTFDMVAIDCHGIKECIRKALKAIDPESNRPIHVSFDIDSLDPIYIPSTGTRVTCGMTLREMLVVAEAVHQTGRMVSLDVVEFNPKIAYSPNDMSTTISNTMSSLLSFLGEKRPSF